MSALQRIHRVLERFLETIAVGLMSSLALLVTAAVVLRKSGSALIWYDELAAVLMAWLTYYGACLAALKQAHIGFPKLVEAAPPRLRTVLLAVREAAVFSFLLLTAWSGWLVLEALGGETLITLPWMPVRVTQSVIPAGAVLFAAGELLTLPGRWGIGGAQAESASNGDAVEPAGER